MFKTCTQCGQILPLEQFYYRSRSRDGGLLPTCKQCCSARAREYNRRPEIRAKALVRERLRPKHVRPLELRNGALKELSPVQRVRFWLKVQRGDNADCWPWKAGRYKNGYGAVKLNRVSYKAHRVAYFLATGRDPGELKVCHSCDNPSCCNPAHLWLGTDADNIADRDQKGRGRVRGELNGNHRLTLSRVQAIRASRELQRVLAKQYGVSCSHISKILTGKTWRHVR